MKREGTVEANMATTNMQMRHNVTMYAHCLFILLAGSTMFPHLSAGLQFDTGVSRAKGRKP